MILAVIVAIGIWALSGESNYSNNKNDLLAYTILNDSFNIQLAFDSLLVADTNPSNIVFPNNVNSTYSTLNILDPLNGIIINYVNPESFTIDPFFFW